MREIRIAPENDGKGRSFGGYLAAYICANGLWTGGEANTDNLRPVWAVVMASEAEIRPLVVNLRMGKKGLFVSDSPYYRRTRTDKLEFLKSGRYATLQQKTPYGVAVTLYLHDLFTLDPGMVDPAGIAFVLALPAATVAAQKWDREGAVNHLKRLTRRALPAAMEELLGLAPYFAAYLDRRSRSPWPTDTRFYAQLLFVCLDNGMASLSRDRTYPRTTPWGCHDAHGLDHAGLASLGLSEAVSFKATHADFEAMLAETITDYFKIVQET